MVETHQNLKLNIRWPLDALTKLDIIVHQQLSQNELDVYRTEIPTGARMPSEAPRQIFSPDARVLVLVLLTRTLTHLVEAQTVELFGVLVKIIVGVDGAGIYFELCAFRDECPIR